MFGIVFGRVDVVDGNLFFRVEVAAVDLVFEEVTDDLVEGIEGAYVELWVLEVILFGFAVLDQVAFRLGVETRAKGDLVDHVYNGLSTQLFLVVESQSVKRRL